MWQDRFFAETAPSYWSLLFVFALSLGLTADHLLQVFLSARAWAARLDRLSTVATLFVAALLSVDVIHRSYVWVDGAWQILFAMLVFCVAAAVPYLHWWLAKMQAFARSVRGLLIRGVLGATCVAAACWSGLCFYGAISPIDDMGFFFDVPGRMAELHRLVAVTDAGETLPLFRWDVTEEVSQKYSAISGLRLSGLVTAVIQRAPPDRHANCHGWVFTGGKFLLRGGAVEQILRDNGYRETPVPRAEDLVVYRSEGGQIVHTGIVRGVLDDGTVMVESKFGVDGRYLHQPQDQPFSALFAYYRTSRPGHLIAIQRSRCVNHASDRRASDHAARPSVGRQVSARSAGNTDFWPARS